VGANRDFVKGTGACLCTIGFQPKNNLPNLDSTEDCEEIVTNVCTADQQTSVTGECLDADQQVAECNKQCPGSGGTMITGTGLCQCSQITDVDEICNANCQKNTVVKSSLNAKGQMTLENPVTGEVKTIDPTSLEGYYGDFRCQTTDTSKSSCAVRQMGQDENGSFTYQFEPNKNLLEKAGVESNLDKTTEAKRIERQRRREK
jgi:hypothetical protein